MAKGRVVQILGGVVDVEFPPDQLPEIYEAIEVPHGRQHPGPGSARSTWAIIGCAAWRWIRPTACSAASLPTAPARRSWCR